MSGGHYNYQYTHLEHLADDIEKDFLNSGIRPDYYDYLSDADIEQTKIILKEVKKLVKDLRKCAKRAKELEWLMSADIGSDSYIKGLKKM